MAEIAPVGWNIQPLNLSVMPKTAKKGGEGGRGELVYECYVAILVFAYFWRKKITVNLVEVGQRGKKVLV